MTNFSLYNFHAASINKLKNSVGGSWDLSTCRGTNISFNLSKVGKHMPHFFSVPKHPPTFYSDCRLSTTTKLWKYDDPKYVYANIVETFGRYLPSRDHCSPCSDGNFSYSSERRGVWAIPSRRLHCEGEYNENDNSLFRKLGHCPLKIQRIIS
jgi:hypothetical protein